MVALNDDPAVTDLTPLRYVRSITAPLSPLQARRFTEKFGVTVLNGYGQAEIGEVIGWTAADAREHPEKLGALGRPHPGVDVKIVDESGEDTNGKSREGEVGRLLVRAPSMAAGDASGGDFADRLDADGFLDTGDLGRIDTEGFVWIEGRAGDVINRGGNKVFPEAVEEVLRLAPGVVDVAVVGMPDDRLGEVPVAFVVVGGGEGGVTDDDLRVVCKEHLVPYKVPVAFHRIDELPRSEVGKVLRRDLAQLLTVEAE
jgi:long-chain acyl-CoA synthetase